MSKHTPGMWVVVHSGIAPDIAGPHFEVTGDGNERVCSLSRSGGRMRMEANGKLISAAPELLEVLKEVQAWRNAGVGLAPPPKTYSETLGRRIDEAIERATK